MMVSSSERTSPDTDDVVRQAVLAEDLGGQNGVGLGALGATTFYGEFGQYKDQFGWRLRWPLTWHPTIPSAVKQRTTMRLTVAS